MDITTIEDWNEIGSERARQRVIEVEARIENERREEGCRREIRRERSRDTTVRKGRARGRDRDEETAEPEIEENTEEGKRAANTRCTGKQFRRTTDADARRIEHMSIMRVEKEMRKDEDEQAEQQIEMGSESMRAPGRTRTDVQKAEREDIETREMTNPTAIDTKRREQRIMNARMIRHTGQKQSGMRRITNPYPALGTRST